MQFSLDSDPYGQSHQNSSTYHVQNIFIGDKSEKKEDFFINFWLNILILILYISHILKVFFDLLYKLF